MKHDTITKTIKQYLLFLIGLFIASMGVAFSTKAGLGTSPVASVPYSVSLVSDLLSFGGWLNVLSVIQITVQVALLRRKCKPLEIIIQTILAFVYGYLTNLSCYLIRDIPVRSYPEPALSCRQLFCARVRDLAPVQGRRRHAPR